MYKLIKLARLLRILKFGNKSNKLIKYMRAAFKIGSGFERLSLFMFASFLLFHIASCLWLIIGKFGEGE